MNKITIDGQMDRMFTDDRDALIEKMSAKERVPSYGSNSLHAPKRALTPAEAEIIDRVGTPAQSSAGEQK